MPCCRPSSRARASFSSDEEVPYISTPRIFPICTAAVPPPPATTSQSSQEPRGVLRRAEEVRRLLHAAQLCSRQQGHILVAAALNDGCFARVFDFVPEPGQILAGVAVASLCGHWSSK